MDSQFPDDGESYLPNSQGTEQDSTSIASSVETNTKEDLKKFCADTLLIIGAWTAVPEDKYRRGHLLAKENLILALTCMVSQIAKGSPMCRLGIPLVNGSILLNQL